MTESIWRLYNIINFQVVSFFKQLSGSTEDCRRNKKKKIIAHSLLYNVYLSEFD